MEKIWKNFSRQGRERKGWGAALLAIVFGVTIHVSTASQTLPMTPPHLQPHRLHMAFPGDFPKEACASHPHLPTWDDDHLFFIHTILPLVPLPR